MVSECSRQHVVDVLRRCGLPDLADEALRILPDPVDVDQLIALGTQYGVSKDDLISLIGGSP